MMSKRWPGSRSYNSKQSKRYEEKGDMGKKLFVETSIASEAAEVLQNDHPAQTKRLNFSDPAQREAHIQAFLEWLPPLLHEAPGIQWNRLSSSIIGYLIRTVANDSYAIPITLVVGCSMHAMKQQTLYHECICLTNLLRRLRDHYGLQTLSELSTHHIWDCFAMNRMLSHIEFHMLGVYESFAAIHLRSYLEELDVRQRMVWEAHALSPLPAHFIEKYGVRKAVHAAVVQRRKEQSDVLVPLFPLLVEIAQLRKQATERLMKEFRRHRDRAMLGEITLPYHFQYTEHVFSMPQDASTISEVSLVEREVAHSFTLWNRTSWVREHFDHYGRESRRQWKQQKRAYAPERDTYFLQYEGPTEDLLWCGNLIANHQLGRRPSSSASRHGKKLEVPPTYTYFEVSRSGLLTPGHSDTQWLINAMQLGEGVLFEPESLYRGVLYATALATLALTNGSRLSELLQVSATRFETLVIDELKNQQPTGRKIGILVQHLLPKGARQESERQFFLIGEMAARLLTEIGQLLESTHGGSIPITYPYDNKKKEDLQPEPYLFQWAASRDGRIGLLKASDVGSLLRFLFYGLTLTTRTGKPIRVAAHLLRHVLATHMRHVKNVPAEAVAYLLHHRVRLADGTHTLSISEATAYYSRMPLEQLLALLFEAQSTLTAHRGRSYLQVPTPRTLEQMDAALRKVFEQWGLIGPTVLGYCSAGMCIRPDNRVLCLNCPYLVPHYSNLPKAKTWRKLYVLQAELHDAHGHHVDAQQARKMIQYLDDIINVMHIQIRTRQDGGYLPFADTLPPATGEEGDA
jgi:hypothetical protein